MEEIPSFHQNEFPSLVTGLVARYRKPAGGNRWSVNHMKEGKLPSGTGPVTFGLSERSHCKVHSGHGTEKWTIRSSGEAVTADVSTSGSKGWYHHKRGTRRSEVRMANTHTHTHSGIVVLVGTRYCNSHLKTYSLHFTSLHLQRWMDLRFSWKWSNAELYVTLLDPRPTHLHQQHGKQHGVRISLMYWPMYYKKREVLFLPTLGGWGSSGTIDYV